MFNSIELFCVIDDFFLKFEVTYWKFLKQSNRCLRIRTSQLSISITIIAIWYKCSHFNNFKAFFSWLKQDKCNLFKSLPCYQRMIHLINMHQLALHALNVALVKDQYKQYLWIDSTSNGHIAYIKMVEQLVAGLQAKLYADRGYISKELKSSLIDQGIDLITYPRKNMKFLQLKKLMNIT